MPHNTFTLLAPAKINLFLHITGKREDGYHLLQSLMTFVDIGDTLQFSPHESLFIDIDGPFAQELENPRDNLVYKAAAALATEYNTHPRGKIVLNKRLPIASGMGGGSSDAAATLAGLAKLWGLPEEPDRLHKVAARLGADVPACLVRKPVWAEGIGEKMTRLSNMPDLHMALVNPQVSTPTTEVFKHHRGRYSPPLQFTGRRKSMHEWISDLKMYRNDLTDAAMRVSPIIQSTLEALQDTPNCHFARLSGSGATCFGIYDNADAAYAAVNKIRARHPDWWIMPANVLK